MKLNTKTLILILALVIAPAFSVFAQDENKTEKEIAIQIVNKVPNRDRSISQYVEAVYYSDMSVIDIICYGSKETLVYIVNKTGDIIACDTFDFTLSPYLSISAPFEQGTYWLVLDSAELFAGGVFSIE